MNKLKFIKHFYLGILSMFLVFSCNFPPDEEFFIPFEVGEVENPVTLTQIIIARDDFSIMETAMRLIEERGDTKILSEFNVPGATTIFVPNDTAFQTWLDENEIDDLALLDIELIERLIMNHVLPGGIQTSANFVTGLTSSTAEVGPRGQERNVSMYIDTTNGVTINGESNVIDADVEANNGIIHVVDTVIDLPVLLDLSNMIPSLSIFNDAVNFAQTARDEDGNGPNLRFRLVDPGAERTLFMPTNDAFADLLAELGVAELSEADPSVVADAIFTHLIDIAPISSSEFIAIGRAFPIPAFNNELLFIDPTDATNITVTDPNGRTANLDSGLIDLVAINGLVHVIDRVLLAEPEM
jgi:uncharacterized surface protein with fasciclin (FAS1) repeats